MHKITYKIWILEVSNKNTYKSNIWHNLKKMGKGVKSLGSKLPGKIFAIKSSFLNGPKAQFWTSLSWSIYIIWKITQIYNLCYHVFFKKKKYYHLKRIRNFILYCFHMLLLYTIYQYYLTQCISYTRYLDWIHHFM